MVKGKQAVSDEVRVLKVVKKKVDQEKKNLNLEDGKFSIERGKKVEEGGSGGGYEGGGGHGGGGVRLNDHDRCAEGEEILGFSERIEGKCWEDERVVEE